MTTYEQRSLKSAIQLTESGLRYLKSGRYRRAATELSLAVTNTLRALAEKKRERELDD